MVVVVVQERGGDIQKNKGAGFKSGLGMKGREADKGCRFSYSQR